MFRSRRSVIGLAAGRVRCAVLPPTNPNLNGLTPMRSCWRRPSCTPPRTVAHFIRASAPVEVPENFWNIWVATISKSAKASWGDSAGVVSELPSFWNISASGSTAPQGAGRRPRRFPGRRCSGG